MRGFNMRHFILLLGILVCALIISGCVQQTTSDSSKVSTPNKIPINSQSLSSTIDITSNPSNGQVYLDNEFKGNTPTTIKQVSMGPHKIEVRISGFQTWNTSFEVNPENSTLRFSPTLKKYPRGITDDGIYIYVDNMCDIIMEYGVPPNIKTVKREELGNKLIKVEDKIGVFQGKFSMMYPERHGNCIFSLEIYQGPNLLGSSGIKLKDPETQITFSIDTATGVLEDLKKS